MRRAAPLALLATFVFLAPSAAADWASFHADSFNTGAVDSDLKLYEGIWWSMKGAAATEVQASPVVKDGRLITADMGGNVRAVDAESGFEFWTYKMPAAVSGTPAVAGDHVFVVDVKGNLKSLNLGDGRVEHQASVGPTLGSISEHEGKIFIGTEAGEMKAFAYQNGLTLLWTFRSQQVATETKTDSKGVVTCDGATALSPRPIRGKPAVYDGKVFFGSHNHYVLAVSEGGNGDLTTSIKWIYKTNDIIEGSPTIASTSVGPLLVIGSYDGKAYAFRPSPSGEGVTMCYGLKATPVWTYQVPSVQGTNQVSRIHSSPANANGKVFFGANNGHVYGVFANNGTRAWDQTAGNEILQVTGSPAVSNGIVVVGSEDKNVYWLDAKSGAVLKKYQAQAAIKASPAIDNGKVFVAGLDGTWYAFGPAVPDRPDLSVTLTPPPVINKVTAVVKNEGKANSTATIVRVYTGTLVIDIDVGPIAPGKSVTVTNTNVTLPKGNAIAIRAFVDPTNLVRESDESDNQYSATVKIAAAPPPPPAGPAVTTTTGKGKIPAWDLAVPIALLAVGLLLRRRLNQ